jgi:hypothetical protein
MCINYDKYIYEVLLAVHAILRKLDVNIINELFPHNRLSEGKEFLQKIIEFLVAGNQQPHPNKKINEWNREINRKKIKRTQPNIFAFLQKRYHDLAELM